jgi:hypothetical protein
LLQVPLSARTSLGAAQPASELQAMLLLSVGVLSLSLVRVLSDVALDPPTTAQADAWSEKYRNWTYFPTYVMPPIGPKSFTDCAQVWQVPGEAGFRMSFLVFDGIGYETHLATSDDLVTWKQKGVIFSPREQSPPLDWNATPGEFDYGGAAFIGPLLVDYNISSPRVLAKQNGKFWFTYFGQPRRNAIEPPPGATGMASSMDGSSWKRAISTPILSCADPGRGAWEATQIYAPYLIRRADGVCDIYYNANSGRNEQSGIAHLKGGCDNLPGIAPGANSLSFSEKSLSDGNQKEDAESLLSVRDVSEWQRDTHNPVIANGKHFDSHQAADPKVYWDGDLVWSTAGTEGSAGSAGAAGGTTSIGSNKGAWTMFYFGTGPDYKGASIDVAFSADGITWTKASTPLYLAGGHPNGLDSVEAHKNWIFGINGTMYMYYTAAGAHGRGIALLTSKPVPVPP